MFAKFSVKKPLTVFVAVLMVIILGFVSFTKMTPDLLPSMNLPYAIVITSYPGATPEEVETQVSKPLEQAMASLENINDISSVSRENASQLMLEFSDSANMDTMVHDIREKINGVSGYWDDKVGTPYIVKLNPDLLPVTVAAVEREGMNNVELTQFLEEDLLSKLEGISGVASVSVSGNVQEQLDIVLSEKKLKKLNDRIKKSLDGKFDDAEEELQEKLDELREGKDTLAGKESELESARSELESGQFTLIEKSAEAEGQLQDKKEEIEEAKSLLKTQISEARSQLTTLQESEKLLSQLNEQYEKIQQGLNEVDTQIAELTESVTIYSKLAVQKADLERKIAALEGGEQPSSMKAASFSNILPQMASASLAGEIGGSSPAPAQSPAPEVSDDPTDEPSENPTEKPTEKPTEEPTEEPTAAPTQAPASPKPTSAPDDGELAELRAQLKEVEAQMAKIEASLQKQGLTPETAAEKIVELQGQKAAIETSLNGLNAALEMVGVSIEDLGATLAEMQKNIAAIEAGIAQMEAAILELDNGSITVNGALEELRRQQAQGSLQISQGLSQLTAGQSALESAKAEMDSAEGQLDEAQEQIADQRETAYKSANVEITMDMVNQILMAQNFSMPVGYITDGDVDYLVRVGDKIEGVEELQNLILFDTGIEDVGAVTLEDVADVALTDNSQDLYAKINGNDGIILSFQKQSTYATATVSENIAKKFTELGEKYEGLAFSNLSDQGDYIDIVINSVLENLIMGAILAILILMLFLKDIKPTVVIACSIPISVLFAIVLMYFSGITLNVISLSGLAVGVGMLVDNSVVVIENIYRMRSEGELAIKAAVYGTLQVTGAIVASTLTTICVFLPIVFVEGITRQLFVDMALTIAYSLLASLIVAITLVPAMASGMLRNSKEKNHKLFDKALSGYERIARLSLRHKWVVIVFSLFLLASSTYIVLQKGFIFMPAMSGTQISVTAAAPEDATFAQKREMADAMYERVSGIEDIGTLGVMISGESGASMMGMGGGSGDITMYAILKDDAKRKDSVISKEILEKCADLSGEISAQGAMDMSSMMSSMSGTGVTINIYGDDLDDLITEAQQVGSRLSAVAGIGEVSTGIEDATPEIRIVVDKKKAMNKGLTVAQVYQLVAAQIKDETASAAVKVGQFEKDIVIYSEKNQGMTVKDVRNMKLTVTDKEGEEEEIRLSSIADIKDTKSLNAVNRSNQRRYITVTAGLAEGYNITKVAEAVESEMASYTAIEGNTIEIGGESDTIMEAVTQLVYMALLALVIIYFIMVAQFQSFKSPFIVMFTIPLAFTGGFLALLITGKDLSVVSIVGFIMLAGIIVNNGIVLIDYINTLRLDGVEKKEAIIQAGRTRMRPILMTALTTILGLVFMAVGTGFGSELMQPMAIVCIGGLTYATIMTLFVVPAMYDIFSRKEMHRVDIDAEPMPEQDETPGAP